MRRKPEPRRVLFDDAPSASSKTAAVSELVAFEPALTPYADGLASSNAPAEDAEPITLKMGLAVPSASEDAEATTLPIGSESVTESLEAAAATAAGAASELGR